MIEELRHYVATPGKRDALAAWKTFLADPDWAAVRAESEQDGALVASLKSIMLETADGF